MSDINQKNICPGVKHEELLARIKLNAAFPYNTDRICLLMEIFGNASEAVKADAKDLFQKAGFTLDSAEKTVKFFKDFSSEKEIMLAEKNGIKILTKEDNEYPEKLSFICDAPIVIYTKGDCSNLNRTAAAIVGTRHPSPYGLRMASEISSGIAAHGVSVVSGLARGIDSAAHKAALACGGITWAVLGTGLLQTYPAENSYLADKIANSGGTVISEYPLMQKARQISFPRRNRIISGISNAVTVIEGTFRSGSLITARCALEQGRDVLALPGHADSIYSQGPHYLIKNGAYLAESADDVLSCITEEFRNKIRKAKKEEKIHSAEIEKLSAENAEVYNIIASDKNGFTADEIALKWGKDVPLTSASLFELEVSGLICQKCGRYAAT
ncbi:MAG: DNA-processing protein DprA [Elusimicrobiales bacterium]|nr:DNA-processing protein DprA [Elusimicrobiales bacterium]